MKRSRAIFALILAAAATILVGCSTTAMPEPTAVHSQTFVTATNPATIPATSSATPLPESPTVEPTAEPTAESLSTATLYPTAILTPTNTPDPHIPPPDAALGSVWPGPAEGMDMVFVPGGTFKMGSADPDVEAFYTYCEQVMGEGKCWFDWFADEQPYHAVSLSDFWMQRTEVTNAQYAAFLDELGNQHENEVQWYDIDTLGAQIIEQDGTFLPLSDFANHPVVAVTWHGADAYCDWYDALLPTEAQWEYAARGGENKPYPWGDGEPTCEMARYWQCGGKSVPVDANPQGASWTGTLNMAGNVWEWVADWYDSGAYVTAEVQEPVGPPLGKSKILRGGGWETQPYDLRSSNRSFGDPKFAADVIGFRCVVPGS